jgi:competence protein ComEC
MQKGSNAPWKEAPFLWLFPLFAAGILFGWYLPVDTRISAGAWLLLLLLLLSFPLLSLRLQFSWQPVRSLLLCLFIIASGYSTVLLRDAGNRSNCMLNTYQKGSPVLVELETDPVERPKSSRAMARTLALSTNNQPLKTASGRLWIYFSRDSANLARKAGDIILINTTLSPIRNTQNPGAFDYRQYCYFRSCYFQVWLRPDNYRVITKSSAGRLQQILQHTRNRILAILHSYIKGREERGLAEALLIGYKDDLDEELKQHYMKSGVMHVIAISGLHLGLVYGLLNILLLPLKRWRRGRLLAALINICCLWFFALLTGASPSVLRSALMFSCIILSAHWGKTVSSYNSLAASAFLLLCYQPFWLWDAGFQLSYLAVLSIFIFHQRIRQILPMQKGWLFKIWQLCALSIAAQILTLPLSIYLFHRIPYLFLAGNLLAVPLSGIILTGEIILCLCSPLTAVAALLGKIIQYLIAFLNNSLAALASLPFSQSGYLKLTVFELYSLYGLLAGLLILFSYRSRSGLLMLLCTPLLLMGSRLWREWHQNDRIILYQLSGQCTLDYWVGRQFICLYNKVGDAIGQTNHDYLLKSRLYLGAKNREDSLPAASSTPYFLCGQYRILILDKLLARLPDSSLPAADIIILTGNPAIRIAESSLNSNRPLWVAAPDNAPWRINAWDSASRAAGMAFHSVVDKGAFVLPLP